MEKFSRRRYLLPDFVESRRLVVSRAVSDHDRSLLADFFNASGQDYPSRHFNWPVYDIPYSKGEMPSIERHIRRHGDADRYLFLKGRTKVIGALNFSSDRHGSARLAYYISPEFRRKGYAGEAHKAALRAFFQANSRMRGMWEEVAADNHASRKILIKNGFKLMGQRHSTHFGAYGMRYNSFYCSRESVLD